MHDNAHLEQAHGLREDDRLKLVRSLVVSRMTNTLQYHSSINNEIEKQDPMTCKAYKTWLLLPQNTSTEKLIALGLQNTFAELREAQLTAQMCRLKQTATARALLRRLGYVEQTREIWRTEAIHGEYCSTLKMAPIPRNIDPNLHKSRRKAKPAEPWTEGSRPLRQRTGEAAGEDLRRKHMEEGSPEESRTPEEEHLYC